MAKAKPLVLVGFALANQNGSKGKGPSSTSSMNNKGHLHAALRCHTKLSAVTPLWLLHLCPILFCLRGSLISKSRLGETERVLDEEETRNFDGYTSFDLHSLGATQFLHIGNQAFYFKATSNTIQPKLSTLQHNSPQAYSWVHLIVRGVLKHFYFFSQISFFPKEEKWCCVVLFQEHLSTNYNCFKNVLCRWQRLAEVSRCRHNQYSCTLPNPTLFLLLLLLLLQFSLQFSQILGSFIFTKTSSAESGIMCLVFFPLSLKNLTSTHCVQRGVFPVMYVQNCSLKDLFIFNRNLTSLISAGLYPFFFCRNTLIIGEGSQYEHTVNDMIANPLLGQLLPISAP